MTSFERKLVSERTFNKQLHGAVHDQIGQNQIGLTAQLKKIDDQLVNQIGLTAQLKKIDDQLVVGDDRVHLLSLLVTQSLQPDRETTKEDSPDNRTKEDSPDNRTSEVLSEPFQTAFRDVDGHQRACCCN